MQTFSRFQGFDETMTRARLPPTPKRSSRGSGRRREYRLQIASNAGEQNVGGLAYRTGAGKWKTKMLFF